MESILFKLLAFILATYLLFVLPLLEAYERQDQISYQVAMTAANEFTQVVRHKGRLEERAYGLFLDQLAATGNLYKVELEHYEQVYVPMTDASGLATGDYYEGYQGNFTQDILDALESQGAYGLEAMDLFYVVIENDSKTKSQSMKEWLYHMETSHPVIYVRSGGMVWYEPD